MLSPEDLGFKLTEILGNQHLAVLATEDSGQPHTSLVGFVASDDLRSVCLATSRATRKFRNLKKNEQVAMLIDDRSHSAEDFQRAGALTLYGRAREASAERRAPIIRRYLDKFPHLSAFVSSPGCALVEIQAQRYSLVTRFQEVADLEVEPWTWSAR